MIFQTWFFKLDFSNLIFQKSSTDQQGVWSGLLLFICFSIVLLCIDKGALSEVQLQIPQSRYNGQQWSLIQDTEFTEWMKIQNKDGSYLGVKNNENPVLGGIIIIKFSFIKVLNIKNQRTFFSVMFWLNIIHN